jgi:histidine triad (HIT) family protein
MDEAKSAGNCIFCAIVEGRAPAEIVYEDETTLAFMDINPANRGHTLIIPRQHAMDLSDIGQEAAAAVMRTAVHVAGAIRECLSPDGLNLFHASGRAAFQSVFHFHVHIVPRWWGDALMLPWRPTRGDPSAIRSVAAQIREHLQEQ